MSENKRWKGFKWEFDEEKYMPALGSLELEVFELQLRKSAGGLHRSTAASVDGYLNGFALPSEQAWRSSKLGVAGQPATRPDNMSIRLGVDEDFVERRERAQLETGDPENFDKSIDAYLGHFEGKWFVQMYVSAAVFEVIKDGVLNQNIKTLLIRLSTKQALTESFNEHVSWQYTNWYLLQDSKGNPITANCHLESVEIMIGEVWPLRNQKDPIEGDDEELDSPEPQAPLTTADKVMLQQLAIAQSMQGSVEVIKRYALVTMLAAGVVVLALLFK